jgi:hypothetical protein
VLAEAGFSFKEIANDGYTITTAGDANVAAQSSQPTVEPNETLLAAAATLFAEGRVPSRGRKTKTGRIRKVLGTEDGISPYNVVVTIHPDFA